MNRSEGPHIESGDQPSVPSPEINDEQRAQELKDKYGNLFSGVAEARIKEIAEDVDRVEVENIALRKENEKLEANLEVALERGITDRLTGLDNRHGLDEKAQLLLGQLKRGQINSLTIMMVDIDKFKIINKRHGHVGGDAVLRGFAEEIKKGLLKRSTDVAARYGGEEFVFLFPNETPEGVMKRLKEMYGLDPNDTSAPAHLGMIVQGLDSAPEDEDHTAFTMSGGIAEFILPDDPKEPLETTIKNTIERVNKGLFWAKENGRDKIVICDATTMARRRDKKKPTSLKSGRQQVRKAA